MRRGWIVLLALDAAVAAVIAWAGSGRAGFWPLFAAAATALPVLLIGSLYAVARWKLWRVARRLDDAARADEVAGVPGTTRRMREIQVWSAPGTSLADLLETELEIARRRLEGAVGRSAPVPSLRALFFETEDAIMRYVATLGVSIDPRYTGQSSYLRAPYRRLLIAERALLEQTPEPRIALRALLMYPLFEAVRDRPIAAWIDQGLRVSLAHDDEHHELARLHRRVAAGRAAGRTFGAAELLTSSVSRIWRRYGRHRDLSRFARADQFNAQAWSFAEFLCGRGATPERRLAFQRFFNDPAARRRPAEAMARHFGYPCEEIFGQWQRWAEEQAGDEHHPPPAHVAAYLSRDVIPKVASSDTLPGERVAAIRVLGEHGYLLGADRLVDLLREDDDEIRAEAVWALECISGHVRGTSPADWEFLKV